MHLDTPRLAIGPLDPDAVDPLVALWTDAEVTRYMGGIRGAAAVAASIRAAADARRARTTFGPCTKSPRGGWWAIADCWRRR